MDYKVPNVDMNKLRSLEKIYLQRIENSGANKGTKVKTNAKKPANGKKRINLSPKNTMNIRTPKDVTDAMNYDEDYDMNPEYDI